MSAQFEAAFASLKPVLEPHLKRMSVEADTPAEYTVHSKIPSPFPQHKGKPLFFASIRQGKAYVSFHLMPIYMCPELESYISPALKKRMQGKACFNFKAEPDAELIRELKKLISESVKLWRERKWI